MGRVLIELLVFVVCLLVTSTRGNRAQPCGSYGCPYRPRYEPFVPAPPGQTPRCAKPGQTFCEVPDHYPQLLIKFLVDKCSYDFASILRDEAHFDFDSYKSKPEYDQGYEYPRQQVPQFYPEALPVMTPSSLPQYSVRQGQPAIVYGPPSNDTDHEGYNYDPPVRSQRNSYVQDTTTSTLLKAQENFRNFHNPRVYKNLQIDTPNQEQQELWSNRYSRDSTNGSSRSRRENPFLEFSLPERSRKKRQSDNNVETIPLCRSDSRYISPRAALNSQGNWMYVVNLSESREKYTQLVRSETCSTTECNGLCSLPAGYKSNCKQKYVQKRLIALEGTGDRLYTDVFWFPHGCACEVSLDL